MRAIGKYKLQLKLTKNAPDLLARLTMPFFSAIPTNSISNTLMIRPGVGYIRIKDFTSTTVRELDDAISKLEDQGMQKLGLEDWLRDVVDRFTSDHAIACSIPPTRAVSRPTSRTSTARC